MYVGTIRVPTYTATYGLPATGYVVRIPHRIVSNIVLVCTMATKMIRSRNTRISTLAICNVASLVRNRASRRRIHVRRHRRSSIVDRCSSFASSFCARSAALQAFGKYDETYSSSIVTLHCMHIHVRVLYTSMYTAYITSYSWYDVHIIIIYVLYS